MIRFKIGFRVQKGVIMCVLIFLWVSLRVSTQLYYSRTTTRIVLRTRRLKKVKQQKNKKNCMKGGQSQRVEYQTHSQALETTSTKIERKRRKKKQMKKKRSQIHLLKSLVKTFFTKNPIKNHRSYIVNVKIRRTRELSEKRRA